MSAKPVRKNLSKRTRFEVFKRDAFTCQYCGAKAPDVVLHADHIQPVSAGGTNDLLNLVTACQGCNAGKSDKKLDDSTAVQKRRKQADLQAGRLEQIEMMAEWAASLKDEQDAAIDEVSNALLKITERTLSKTGRNTAAKLIGRFGLGLTLRALNASHRSYAVYRDDKITDASVEKIISMIERVAKWIQAYGIDHVEPKAFYAQAIVRNRLEDQSLRCVHEFMLLHVRFGYTPEQLVEIAHKTDSKEHLLWFIDYLTNKDAS